ncbi:WD40/YVTN/BNR-like repeat-containing protein [Massilia suwonensis]|uniref:WD40/YVTN/BNR-like repeat-containing protein n=1 Tax=Massilia suwonensis TaxID=648895 RepID=UPI0036D3CFB6
MNSFSPSSSWPVRRAAALCGALAAAAALAGAPAANNTADVLDLPSAVSPAALKRPMSGIAVQGNSAVAVGMRGTILVSADAGATWKQVAAPVSADLTTVRFTAPNQAWALGHDGVVLRSADSGLTWTRVLDGRSLLALLTKHYRALQASGNADAAAVLQEVTGAAEQSATPGVLSYPFLDIRIGADGTGFLAGAFGFLLHTRDGGKSWEPWLERAGNDRRMHLYALEQGADGSFYLAGEQGLVRRYDAAAGRFVTLETPYAGTFFGLQASEAGLIAFGLRGNAYLSADQGASWKQLALGTQATVVQALACAPGELAFVTQSGQVLLSRDAGASVLDAGLARAGEVFGAALAGPGQLALAGAGGARIARIPGCGAVAPTIGKN